MFKRLREIFRKDKYFFNTHTLRYEKVVASWGNRLLRLFMFFCASLVFSILITSIVYNFVDSPKEKILKGELNALKDQYYVLNSELEKMGTVLDGLQYRDGNIYRVLFETDPIPNSIWEAGSGGVNKYNHLERFDNADLMVSVSKKLDKLKKQMAIQSESYDKISDLIKNQKEMLSSIPSVQPVKNKDLTIMASGFGMRMDPIYKIPKFHSGMDFTAATGTDVYVTGDGVVEVVNYSYGGYGNEIVVNHGYGYRTRYGHLSAFKVRVGQKVKRGDVIAYVGNTGKSTGPHLHYEVIKNEQQVNPVYFYYNDLNDAMFSKMLELSNNPGQTLD